MIVNSIGGVIVSIPDRYGKNQQSSVELALVNYVSIPHRYGKNRNLSPNFKNPSNVSIPHRYGKNEFPQRLLISLKQSFHSS